MNGKMSSKKYIESLLDDSEANELSNLDEEIDSVRDTNTSHEISDAFSPASISSSTFNNNTNGTYPKASNRGHLRSDSTGSSYSHKKKEGVSNSIKALQDKIKKGLDLNEPEESTKSPTISVKSYRANFEKHNHIKSPPPRSAETSPKIEKIKLKPISDMQIDSKPIQVKENRYAAPDTSYESVNPFTSDLAEDKSFHYNNTSITSIGSTAPPVPPHQVLREQKTTISSDNATNSYFQPASQLRAQGSSESLALSIISNKKKHIVPQFKVVKKKSASQLDVPSPNGSITSAELHHHTHELKQLQLIDREISKKIKKIKSEIKFIEDNLPPNPCIHDFQSRKKLASAKETLEKSLEFWEKKKYENGISFSKLTRKVVYSGGEEVTTFFSGRNE